MAAPLSLHRPWAPRPAMESRAARASVTVSPRTGSASAEKSGDASTATTATGPQHKLAPEATAGGATSGPKVDSGSYVGMVEVADADSWDWVSVRATRGFAASKGKHSVEMEVTPVGTRRRRPVRSSRPCGSEDMNSLRYCVDEYRKARLVCFRMHEWLGAIRIFGTLNVGNRVLQVRMCRFTAPANAYQRYYMEEQMTTALFWTIQLIWLSGRLAKIFCGFTRSLTTHPESAR